MFGWTVFAGTAAIVPVAATAGQVVATG